MFNKLKPNKESKTKSPTKIKPISNKPLIVFDIGSKTTKLVMGRFKGSRISIEAMNGSVNGKGSAYDGKILNLAEMSRVGKKLMSVSSLKLKEAVFTVESSMLIRRDMDIPNVPESDVLGLVSNELRQYLPIDINSYILQVKLIGNVKEDGVQKKRIAVAALPKDIAEGFVNFSDTLGLDRNAMDINSNALEKLIMLENSVNRDSEFLDKNVVFIDMGHSFFNVAFYSNGKYLFNRMIPIGGKMVDSAIAERKRISEEEAEPIKIANAAKYSTLDLMHRFSKSKDLPQSSEDKVLYDTKNIYDKWANEISQVLKFFTTRDRKNTIDEIYLYGGCSFISGIDQYFERILKYPTKTFSNFKCIEAGSNEINKTILNYMNCIGAIIRS